MAYHVDLDPGDIILVPPDSGAQIRVVEKSGRRARLSVESARPVKVLRGRDERPATTITRPKVTPAK